MRTAGKLVRDRVHARHPFQCEMYPEPEIVRTLLIAKLHEEVEEIARDQSSVEEYGDVFAVLVQLAAINGVTQAEIFRAARQKWLERGGFARGRFVYGLWSENREARPADTGLRRDEAASAAQAGRASVATAAFAEGYGAPSAEE